MYNPAETVVKKLEEALKPHGAVARFCEETDTGRTTVQHWFSRRSSPNLTQIGKIAEFLKTTPSLLLADEEPISGIEGVAAGLAMAQAALAEMQNVSKLPVRDLPKGVTETWLNTLFDAIRADHNLIDRINLAARASGEISGTRLSKKKNDT